MTKIKKFIPYLIALLCAGFACSQNVFMVMIDRISLLSIKLNYGWFTAILIAFFPYGVVIL